MRAVKALYNGQSIILPLEPVPTKENMEVIVIFPVDENRIAPTEARARLRGSGKGENLTKHLLQSRREDLDREKKA
jgi:hypothetical protein